MSTGTSEIIRKTRPFFGDFGAFSAALHKKNITNRRKIIKNRCGTTDFLQRKGAKMLIHEKVGPRNHTKLARKVYPRNRHEKPCPRISLLRAEYLCTSDSSIPSAPLLLQSSVHERTLIRHERHVWQRVF